MLPNPFQKPLTEFKDTDPLKNREIVRELLGEGGVHKYRKILGENSDSNLKRQKDVSKEDLLAMAAEARAKIDSLSRDSVKPILEHLIEKGYTSQIKSLQEINFLETKDNKLGLTAIDNNFYEVPTEEAIKNHFLSIPNIKQKIDQGFTRLLIVPFGSSLDSLREKTSNLILKHKKENNLLAEDGSNLELNEEEPLYAFNDYINADKSGELLYFLERVGAENDYGKTKKDILFESSSASPFPGYTILLIQENLSIPREGKGMVQAGRDQLEAGKSPDDYVDLLKANPVYSEERGMTPEDWLTLFATNLNQKNKVINRAALATDSSIYLFGCCFRQTADVPYVGWYSDGRQASMDVGSSTFPEKNVGLSLAVG